jgi:hypothetical protein
MAEARTTTPPKRTTIDDFVCYAIERASSESLYPRAIKYSAEVLHYWVKGYDARPRAYLARCVFGNPFRPVAFDLRWRTADVLGLARGIYDERAFDRLPLLADALMDAGCADEQVLGHCRSDGPHVRGCWVVDLVLGKE